MEHTASLHLLPLEFVYIITFLFHMKDFGVLMQNNKLVPLKRKFDKTHTETPLSRMRSRLDRHTKYWPITISSTFIFNLKNVSP
jgi:hypothetical protein